ncbi:hypothetical protein NE236_37065 [Actinoallomurus purpureus]|uniref:hypothetical protein n=1 Tax=Actinoallomurus purpureus TaxID=478114 RepID=UPI00209231AC|nr:hypothetical protein [Actinoallomurus purpureus]MCO6010584.1 hypothetical protein [Actinoallomurus purpureus]
MSEKIVVSLDPEVATDLRDLLYMYGEHYAAGAPIQRLPHEAEMRLGTFLRDLDIALGGSGRMA